MPNKNKTAPKEKPKKIPSIECDEDFVKYNLYDMDINELDKLPDNRKSGFWKLTWTQVALRVLLWAAVVFVNEQGWINPHHDKFVFANF